jgi:murein DD-endopeptidase MepM/ murein hydrolase activator NlpD
MRKPRINLMIMREGDIDSAVRSYSLPGYLPRLALILGAVLVVVVTMAGASIIYFWQAAEDAEALRTENEAMQRSLAHMTELENELERHRLFRNRIAAMIGIDMPSYADSLPEPAMTAYTDTDMGAEAETLANPLSAPIEAAPTELGQLVTECTADPNNRPRGMPVRGHVSRGFLPAATNPGMRHRGIDIATREGVPIYAPASGVVVYAGQDDVLGLMLTIDHGGGFKTVYGHNSRLHARIGDKVVRGDVIALTGNTGESTAPHLHYEIQRDDRPVDPTGFLGK